MKKIQIRVFKDGHIESKTVGIKGKSCQKYITEVENLTNAQTIDSSYTSEYYENEEIIDNSYNEGYQQSGY